MNLLKQAMESFKVMNHVRTDDEFGGYLDTWTEGATFKAAIAKNASVEQLVAEQQGVAESFTIVTGLDITLDYHDVVKRVSDGAYFRITSKTVDSTAHPASTVKIAKVTAEKLEGLPNATDSEST